MLAWKKESVDISDEVPIFHVRYVGSTETFVPNGQGCTSQPLQWLWDNAPNEKHLRKVTIQFSLEGIYMKETDNKKDGEKKVVCFSMESISFCAVDKGVNDRLFCWISKHPVSGKLEVHAVLCATHENAHAMAAVLSRAFQQAYKAWRADRQREERRQMAKSRVFLDAEMGSTTTESPASSSQESTNSAESKDVETGNSTEFTASTSCWQVDDIFFCPGTNSREGNRVTNMATTEMTSQNPPD